MTAGSHEFTTRLDERKHGVGGFLLNGDKYYSTGTLYSDWIAVAARVEGDRLATVMVPVDREGISVVDDWDSMGQRRTATGTTSFTDVEVAPEDVLVVRDRLAPRPAGDVLLQLYLHAVIAGILRGVVRDAAELVRSRTRTFDHAPAPQPVDDPILQETVGRLAATGWVAEAAVGTAADAVQAAEDAVRAGEPTHQVGRATSYAISAVKVHLDRWRPTRRRRCSIGRRFSLGPGPQPRPALAQHPHDHPAQPGVVQGDGARAAAHQQRAVAGERVLLGGRSPREDLIRPIARISAHRRGAHL